MHCMISAGIRLPHHYRTKQENFHSLIYDSQYFFNHKLELFLLHGSGFQTDISEVNKLYDLFLRIGFGQEIGEQTTRTLNS